MEIDYNSQATEDLNYWLLTGNKQILKKITKLIEDIVKNPYFGIGKPEPLKHQLSGKWSRRIDKEHRIIYNIQDDRLKIYSLKGHYK